MRIINSNNIIIGIDTHKATHVAVAIDIRKYLAKK